MKRSLQGLLEVFLVVSAKTAQIFHPSLESLRESDWFCIRVFVTLEAALFYGVAIISVSIEMLPEALGRYILTCSLGGIVTAYILRTAWTFRRRRL